jgi:hypothetical protein
MLPIRIREKREKTAQNLRIKGTKTLSAADKASQQAEQDRAAREAYTKDQVRRRSLMGTNDAMGTS